MKITDHEFRIITPTLKKLIISSPNNEPVLSKKIPKYFFNQKFNYTKKYLREAKLIKTVVYRGLPLNNSKNYFNQEAEMTDSFYKLKVNTKSKINGKRFIQIPNPDYVTFSKFKKYFNSQKNIKGFELISSWHKKNTNNKKYFSFFKLAEEENLPISIEVDYIFRETFNNISFFFKILKQFPKIKFWLPHFGCGIFLHWDRVLDICENTPLLLSSADHSFYWSNIFNTKDFKKIPLAYASDHPFNGFASLKIYKNWKKFKNIK